MRRRPGLLRVCCLALLAVGVWACSDDPSGRGTVTLTVQAGTPLGAAVVEIRGDGVLGAEPITAGWAHLELVAGGGEQAEMHRLVLVQDQEGTLSAELELEDVGAPLPTVSVVLASDGSDLPLASLAGVEARVRR